MNTSSKKYDVVHENNEVQTSVIRMQHPIKGKIATVVGAVHIGSVDYYKNIITELNKHDAVLYEQILPSKNPSILHGINYFSTKQLYRTIAKEISETFKDQISKSDKERAFALLKSRVTSKKLKKDEAIRLYSICLREIIEDRIKNAPVVQNDSNTIVSQSDGINYQTLPSHRKHADAYVSDLENNISIFSRANLKLRL
jgi:hypothetical protein